MLRAEARICDVCGEIIPRGTPYRLDIARGAAGSARGRGAPAADLQHEPDGTMRFDVGARCAAEGDLAALTAEALDPLS